MGREYRTVELDPERAPLMKLAFELYATGDWTVNELAEHLALRGLNTRATPQIPSKPMDKGTLNKLLVHPYYMGLMKFQGAYLPGKHEPLVGKETWQKVQDVLKSHTNGERTREHTHFLKGSLFCGSCGAWLYVHNAKSRSGVRYPYFTCVGRHNKRTDCKQRAVLIEQVERQVEALYNDISFTAEFRQRLEGWLMAEVQKTADESAAERQGLEREKDKLERKQRKLLEAHYADAIPLNLFKDEQGQLSDAIDAIDRQLELHDTHYGEVKEKLSKALEIMENCGETYRSAPEHIKRIYNQALFEKIHVTVGDGTCEVTPQFTGPYALIFGQESLGDATEKPEPDVIPAPAIWRGMPVHPAHFWSGETAAQIFLGDGLHNGLLVVPQGLEPRTTRL